MTPVPPTTVPAGISVREALAADASVIAEIYNQGIEDRIATLETVLRTEAERREWLAARSPRHPVLVAERSGRLAGWGSVNPFNPRPAYRHVADFSIYVARESRGSGVGKALLPVLEARARGADFHKLVLAMFPWNEAAIALYRRAGFREVGTYREQGQLDGRWVDVLLMEKILR